MSSNIVAITLENFQQVVLEESKSKLVLVSFWAEQVPESIELRDALTAKVSLFPDHMVLATVDCQTQGQIAQQFGVQGLPTAVLVKDAQPIDGLTGPQTEELVQAFLDKHLPKVEDTLLNEAKLALVENDINKAYTAASQAYQIDSERADIKIVYADASIQLGKVADAEAMLATITLVDQDSAYQAVMAKLELATQAAESPEIKALEAQLKSEPDNDEIKHKLAVQYSQVNRNEEALEILFRLVQKDMSNTTSKELMLDVLKVLPDGDSLATKYRRKLYTLMY
ncbi:MULTISPECIES: tetratricopeptide repeat protein [Colwelliaceae]|uniref:co-chaperone YbbN n=1 Tax=Colwelliaceae TaxID=267889 RepID=UPI0009711BA5|nr:MULTISPECIES: tetratricopeptide repeat protein [Colwelliaceae]